MCSGLHEILSKYDGLVDWELRGRSAMSVDHADSRTTKLYDRRQQIVLREDVERIRY
jgi:hypothetical protein